MFLVLFGFSRHFCLATYLLCLGGTPDTCLNRCCPCLAIGFVSVGACLDKSVKRQASRSPLYMLSGPGLPPPPPPPMVSPPPLPPCPAPSGPAQPERTHANQREGTMENEPHQSRDRGTVCKEKRAILYGNEHVTMTLLLTSGSNHTIHIFVEHTAPHRRGGANQNDHRPHPTGGGGGDKARNDDITTNKRQQPYHTSVERGGANQKDHRPHSTGGGGGGKEGTRPNKTRRGKQQGQTRQLPT